MKPSISISEANKFTLANLGLLKRAEFNEIPAVIDNLVGLHASRFTSPIFSLGARIQSNNAKAFASELYRSGKYVRIRCIRGTLHILNAIDFPTFHYATIEDRLKTCAYLSKRLGVAPNQMQQIKDSILTILKEDAVTEEVLLNKLAGNVQLESGADIKARKVAIRSLWEANVISRENHSPEWQKEGRNYRINNTFDDDLSFISAQKRTAEDTLITRYFRSYGPATISDAQWWSGVGLGRIREILQTHNDEFIEVVLEKSNEVYYVSKAIYEKSADLEEPEGRVRLLAYEDNLLKGYKTSRHRFVDPLYFQKVYNPAGEANATLLIDGRVKGSWTYHKKTGQIEVAAFESIQSAQKKELKWETDNLYELISDASKIAEPNIIA